MLKTLAGMAASKNLANDRERLSGVFDSDIDISDLLQTPEIWKRPGGLYFTQRLGAQFNTKTTLDMAPLTRRENSNIVGILAAIQGFQVTLLATPNVILKDAGLEKAVYRIERLNFNMQAKHVIQLSWENRHSA